jgi:hypothetical protein
MHNSRTKSERKLIHLLANPAWERQLREALKKIGGVLSGMLRFFPAIERPWTGDIQRARNFV